MLKLIKFGSFGLAETFGGMVGRCVPKYCHGGPPGTRVMTIFVFYGAFEVCGVELVTGCRVEGARRVN